MTSNREAFENHINLPQGLKFDETNKRYFYDDTEFTMREQAMLGMLDRAVFYTNQYKLWKAAQKHALEDADKAIYAVAIDYGYVNISALGLEKLQEAILKLKQLTNTGE